jgi:DNA-directed RNA polymerase specialized sigma24 family protein
MQPPTEPSTRTTNRIRRGRHGDEAELYRRHHGRLLHAVARAVKASPELIEDACQTAWAALLGCSVDRATVFAWLRVVAIREAWRQCARTRSEQPAGGFLMACAGELDLGEHPEPAADTCDLADQVAARIQHAQRLKDLATIKPDDRQTLYLKGLGYRYREIMQITGASYTAVNRRITEGRHALRKLEEERENAHSAQQARADATHHQNRERGAPRDTARRRSSSEYRARSLPNKSSREGRPDERAR